MVDKKNLNRIKGILSARQGAEVPKYETGNKRALPVFNPGDPSFNQWRSKATRASSNYMTAWRDYSILKSEFPTASIDDLASYMESGVGPGGVTLDSLYSKYMDAPSGGTTQQTAIPGANPAEGNPNSAVTTAAANIAAVTANQNSQTVAATIQSQQGTLPQTSPNGQTPEVIATNPVSSAGMNLTPQQIQDLKKANNWGVVGQATSALFNAAGEAVGAKQAATDSNLTKGIDAGYDAVAGIAENLGPVGKIVGTAMKTASVAGDLIQEMGGGTDQQTTMDKWMDSSFFSWNIGMLNGFAGKNTDSFGLDQSTIAQVGSSYGGTVDDLNDAAAKAGKKYGLFSSKARKKANAAIAEAKNKQNMMGDISETASDQRLAVQSMGEQAGLAYSIMTDGGYSQKYTYVAKHGGMLEWNPVETLEWEPQVELNWELPTFKEGGNIEISEELEWIPEFKEGGKTKDSDIPEIEETSQKNVIPEGALHKNKHHMEHAEGLTKKGIPVIDVDGEQQAEIEHSEIIFTLEVTKKLEEYYDIFYSEESSNKDKDQAAIDAGKLLVYQILENTEDRTGLIDSCKQGGSLTLKKSTDDLIEEALEWMPTVILVEEEPKKDVKKKSDKEQLKEALKEVLIELLTK